jgi:hypothetical protein
VTSAVVTEMLLKITIVWKALRLALLDHEKGRHYDSSEVQQLRTGEFGITFQKARKINQSVSLNL